MRDPSPGPVPSSHILRESGTEQADITREPPPPHSRGQRGSVRKPPPIGPWIPITWPWIFKHKAVRAGSSMAQWHREGPVCPSITRAVPGQDFLSPHSNGPFLRLSITCGTGQWRQAAVFLSSFLPLSIILHPTFIFSSSSHIPSFMLPSAGAAFLSRRCWSHFMRRNRMELCC